MGNPAGERKKQKEKRTKKMILRLNAKDAAAEAAAAKPAEAKK